jgi:hypothetical protein
VKTAAVASLVMSQKVTTTTKRKQKQKKKREQEHQTKIRKSKKALRKTKREISATVNPCPPHRGPGARADLFTPLLGRRKPQGDKEIFFC